MGDDDTASRQKIFDHAQAEPKTKIKPDGLGNHFSREPVAAVKGITRSLGHAARSHIVLDSPLSLRCLRDLSDAVVDPCARLIKNLVG